MNDPDIVRRRILALLAKRRPDLDETEREDIVDMIFEFEFFDPDADLTHFWNGVYGVETV